MQHWNHRNQLTIQLSTQLDTTIHLMEDLFAKCDDVVKKEFHIGTGADYTRAYMIYIDGLTDSIMLQQHVLTPLMNLVRPEGDLLQAIALSGIEMVDLSVEMDINQVLNSILKGDTALFVDGYQDALILSSKSLPVRGIEESSTEAVMRGPKDSFNENIRTSTALVRRRIKDPKCKIEHHRFGQRSQTELAIVYMEDIVQEGLVDQVLDQLETIEVDAIYDSGMLEQYLHRKWYSPFPIIQTTERPDKVAASVLEGRVAILVDNSPEALLLPATFQTFFQASDDYYTQWSVATFARLLRYMASIIAIGLPGFYIAIANYHVEMLPTDLLVAIASARSAITFPVVIEVLLMELEFELLREAGIRLPGPLGNTIGIVGGLIVGQAAVDAGLVSTIVVIVVALGALASFTIPNESFASAYRLLKFFLIILCSIWGLYGFVLGMMMIGIHLSGLSSYGVPYMIPAVSYPWGACENKKDFMLRMPIYTMRRRPQFANDRQRLRLREKRKLKNGGTSL